MSRTGNSIFVLQILLRIPNMGFIVKSLDRQANEIAPYVMCRVLKYSKVTRPIANEIAPYVIRHVSRVV